MEVDPRDVYEDLYGNNVNEDLFQDLGDHLLQPLVSVGSDYTEDSIDLVAEAWANFECASAIYAKNFEDHWGGRGYYLNCRQMGNACGKTNFNYHIHLFYKNGGRVSLKAERHLYENSLEEVANFVGWWNCNEGNPNAYQMASFIYIWAGYNDDQYCKSINFVNPCN